MTSILAFARAAPPSGSSAVRSAGASAARRGTTAGVMTAIVLLALNLRTLVASLPPLLTHIRADLGLSGFAAGLLTTLPVLAFGAFAPLAPRLTRRVSIERVLVGCAVLTAVAAGMRGPAARRRCTSAARWPGSRWRSPRPCCRSSSASATRDMTGLLTGAYSMSLGLGATLAAALAVPLEEALGSWEASLAAWALPAALAALVWLPAALRTGTTVTGPPSPGLWRNRLAWNVSLFMGVQSMVFYSGLSWLPSVLEDAGFSEGEAGTLQALGALVQLVPAFAVPMLAARSRNQIGILAAIVAFSTVGVIGLIVAPGAALLWILVFGFGNGGALGLGLILPVLRGADAPSVASLTAMSLCVGYIVAAAGPWLLGAAHDLTGGWTVALIVLAAMCLLELAPGLPASRAVRLEEGKA